jgi:hypothetical protein
LVWRFAGRRIEIERIPGNIPGAYVSIESELIRYIKYHVNAETEKIKIKKFGGRVKG